METGTDCYIYPSSSLDHSSTSFASWLGLLNCGSLRAQSPQSASWFSLWHSSLNCPRRRPDTCLYYFLTFTSFRLLAHVHLLIDGSVEGQYITFDQMSLSFFLPLSLVNGKAGQFFSHFIYDSWVSSIILATITRGSAINLRDFFFSLSCKISVILTYTIMFRIQFSFTFISKVLFQLSLSKGVRQLTLHSICISGARKYNFHIQQRFPFQIITPFPFAC